MFKHQKTGLIMDHYLRKKFFKMQYSKKEIQSRKKKWVVISEGEQSNW